MEKKSNLRVKTTLEDYDQHRTKNYLSVSKCQSQQGPRIRRRLTERKNKRYKSQLAEESQNRSSNQLSSLSSNKKREFIYNKWYIKPEIRMKKPLPYHRRVRTQEYNDEQFFYRKLFDERKCDKNKPFQYVQTEKLQFVKKIPISNLRLLETFKKTQELKKKRVPQIINLLLKKKQDELQPPEK